MQSHPIFISLREERKKYHLHSEKARSQPEKYITIILIDGKRQKTNIPAMIQEAKSTQNLERLQTYRTGTLVHLQYPYGKHTYAFYDIMQWPHGVVESFSVPTFQPATETNLHNKTVTSKDQKYIVRTLATILMRYVARPRKSDCAVAAKALVAKYPFLADTIGKPHVSGVNKYHPCDCLCVIIIML